MDALKSTGKCIFCEKEFAKASISRHLNTHLAKPEKKRPEGNSYHLRIETDARWGKTPYFLNLLVDGKTTFEALDEFLREIWLECCGHMSSFSDPKHQRESGALATMDAYDLLDEGKIDEYERIMEDARGEVPKRRSLQEELYEGLNLRYEYDFGSTTELSLTVLKELPYTAKEIELLSRNEPLKIMCDACGKKPATVLCSVCAAYEDEFYFCKDCAKKHKKTCDDFADYAALPVVNSPRMGVCAYEGGIIDTKRDKSYRVPE